MFPSRIRAHLPHPRVLLGPCLALAALAAAPTGAWTQQLPTSTLPRSWNAAALVPPSAAARLGGLAGHLLGRIIPK